jgi:hypothetical protein
MVSNHFHFFYCTEIPAGSQYDTETLFFNIVPQYMIQRLSRKSG